MADSKAQSGGLRGYLSQSRDLFTSVVLVMPLFVAYQLGVLFTGGMRNGVDFTTSLMFKLLDGNLLGYLAFNGAILLLFLGLLARLRDRGTFHPRLYPWMLLESAVYALLLGSVVVGLLRAVGLGGLLAAGADGTPAAMGLLDKIVMSAGAGLYEEIVFRLFLMGGLFLLAHRVLGVNRVLAAAAAVVSSAVIFSAVHHISEPFTMSAFLFRIGAGLLFALIYQARGLAIAAYTHFLYDVYVMVFRQ